MNSQVDREKILNLIRPCLADVQGKPSLSCKKAFVLAEEHDLKLSDIGAVCRMEMIRISRCQLGCFK